MLYFQMIKLMMKMKGQRRRYKKAVPSWTIYKTFEEGNIVVDIPFDADEEISISSNN